MNRTVILVLLFTGSLAARAEVRVSLGLKPVLDRMIGDNPAVVLCPQGPAVSPKGELYVLHLFGRIHPEDNSAACTVFDRDGKYLRTILPYPANLPDEKLQGIKRIAIAPGVKAPFLYDAETRAVLAGAGNVVAHQPVATADGRFVFIGHIESPHRYNGPGVKRVTVLNADGSMPPGGAYRTGPGAARIAHLAVRRAVAAAAGTADAVIPILHTGKEQVLFPSPGLRGLCRELIEAGAAAVLGHHPHVPQGIELYSGRPIVYSLGSFLFDWSGQEPETDTSFLLELGLGRTGVSDLTVLPIRKNARGGAELMPEPLRSEYLAFLEDIHAPPGQQETFAALWREQCRMLLASWYAPRLARGAMIASSDAAERRRAQWTFLNLLENDEHGEALKESLLDQATGHDRPDPAARRTLEDLMDRPEGFAGTDAGADR